MTREDIRNLVVKAIVNTEELTNVVDTIFKEFNQGKYDPDFDNDEYDGFELKSQLKNLNN